MSGPQVIVAGHSHMLALGCRLWNTPDGSIRTVETDDPRFLALTGPQPRNLAYQDEMVRLAAEHPIVLIWAGNYHFIRFLVQDGPPFDFIVSEKPELVVNTDVELVPEAVIRECYKDLAGLGELLIRLAKVSGSQIFVCGTPPPKSDPDFVKAALFKEPLWREIAKRRGKALEQVGMAPPILMYKLWWVWQSMLREMAVRHGRKFVPVASAALAEDGFLRREFWGRDITHAWGGYGAIMREHLWSAITSFEAD